MKEPIVVTSEVVRSRVPIDVASKLKEEAENEQRTVSNLVAKILWERYYGEER